MDKGTLCKTANGRASYEWFELEADQVFEVATLIESAFEVSATMLPVFGLDGVYLDMADSRGRSITIGWDNWSGLFVMARCDKSDALVQSIGQHVDRLWCAADAVPASAGDAR